MCKFQLFTLQHTQSCQKPLKKKNLNIWKKVSKYSYSIWEDWVSFGTKTLILHTTYETQGVCKIHVLALEHTQSCKKPLQQKKWNILKKVYKYSRSIWEDWVSFGTKTLILHTPWVALEVCKIKVLVPKPTQSSQLLLKYLYTFSEYSISFVSKVFTGLCLFLGQNLNFAHTLGIIGGMQY